MSEFKGKAVIVTGGGRGSGRGSVEAFLRAGAQVAICGRNEPESLPEADGRTAHFIQADIRDAEQAANVVKQTVDMFGRLDVLVNNAGGSPPANAADASPRFVESIIKLNLLAPMFMAQEAHKVMKDQENGGAIVNIASVSGVRPSPGTSAYGAAKAGLLNVTTSLAQEWAADNVRVNAIIAGMIKTEAALDHFGGAKGLSKIEAALPMGRMAVPEDMANAVMFLSSDKSNYITGACLEVHGGGEPPAFLKIVEDALKG